jgi:hypothetical protein
MKSRLLINSLVFTTLLILHSCDQYNPINYNIRNNSTETIVIDSVEISVSGGSIQGQYPNNLISGEAKTIMIYEVISSKVRDPEGQTYIGHLQKVVIYRLRDSAYLKQDILLRNNWLYQETGEHSATLELSINDNDFK